MKSKTKKILFSAISGLAIVGTGLGFGLGFGLPKKDSDGIITTDTTTYTKVEELWNGKYFSRDNMDILFKSITGKSSATIANIDSLASSTATAANIRTNNGGKDIVVRLGGLDWQVMYLSKDSDGNAIATLWLSSNEQDAFVGRASDEGDYYGYVKSPVTGKTGLYSDWSSNWAVNTTSDGNSLFYPSTMYGTSYIRAVTLNNGGTYATSTGKTVSVNKNSKNVFSSFTMLTEGEKNDLTDFIITPRNVLWQKDEKAKSTGGLNYNCSNDAWNPETLDTGFYSAGCNYAEHNYYDQWADDYIWLPSIAEIGISSQYSGLWKTSQEQRQNYDGSTTTGITGVQVGILQSNQTASPLTWFRTSSYSSPVHSISLSVLGNNWQIQSVSSSAAVRPALHLNLDLADDYAPEKWIDIADTDWEGSGTQASPYLISTPQELAGIASQVYNDSLDITYNGVYFKQTKDIDLNGLEWVSIGYSHAWNNRNFFQGNYDGGNFSIIGLRQTGAMSACGGLFGSVQNGTLKNIHLYGAYIDTSNSDIGGICGYGTGSSEGTTISNCIVEITIAYTGDDSSGEDIGGIAGDFRGTIENCQCVGNIEGYQWVGGIVGELYGEVTSCQFKGTVKGGLKVGGITGLVWNSVSQAEPTKIENCIVDGYISGETQVSAFVGGISSGKYLAISNCAGFGFVKSSELSSTGIFVGYNEGTINSINTCSFNGSSNLDILYVGTGSYGISGCYIKINHMKYRSSGDFSGYTIMNNMNNGLPMQNTLYAVAIGGNTGDEVIANLNKQGFNLYS